MMYPIDRSVFEKFRTHVARLIFWLVMIIVAVGEASLLADVTFNVQQGSVAGPGVTTPGAKVDLFANPYPSNSGFDHWSGDTSLLADPRAAHTSFIAPASGTLNLTAIYKAASSAWSVTTETIVNGAQSSPYNYFFPTNPKGVILFFHGAGGSANGWLNVENFRFWQDAVANGYAVVATESVDRTTARWNANRLPTANPDVLNVANGLSVFKQRGLMTSDTPLFSVAMSQGGTFSSIATFNSTQPISSVQPFDRRFSAQAIYHASGNLIVMGNTTIPTIYNIGQNDTVVDNTRSIGSYNNLVSRGIAAEININVPAPLYDLRFARIPGVTQTDSTAIFNSLKNGGFLDVNGFLLQSPTTSGWQSLFPTTPAGLLSNIYDQLQVSYTEHQFHSDFNHRTLSFFEATLTAVPEPGSLGLVSVCALVSFIRFRRRTLLAGWATDRKE